MPNVIIDCDPGIDDALALMLAAGSPELRLMGVSCVAGNRPLAQTVVNAAGVLAIAGCAEVPVHAGCARPIAHAQARCNQVHGDNGLGGVSLPAGRLPEALHAIDFLADALRADPGSITLVAIGPLTNLAMVEIKHPGTLRLAKDVLVMGGAAFRRGNITPHAEFNFYADAMAAHVVVDSGAALTLFGLDVTEQARMSAGWIASLGELGSRCGQAAHDMLAGFAAKEPLLHDSCPVAYAIEPSLFEGERHVVSVDWHDGPSEGRLHAVRPAPGQDGNAHVITGVDGDRLLGLVRERVARLP